MLTYRCCKQCQADDCSQPVCPDNDPHVYMDCCGELRCHDCAEGHVCWPAEVPC